MAFSFPSDYKEEAGLVNLGINDASLEMHNYNSSQDDKDEVGIQTIVPLEPSQRDIVVHTKGGPALLSASLWPCLQIPPGKRQSFEKKSLNEIVLSQDNIILSGRRCMISEDLVDLDKGKVDKPEAEIGLHHKESDKDSMGVLDNEGVTELWVSPKKRREGNIKFSNLNKPLGKAQGSRIMGSPWRRRHLI